MFDGARKSVTGWDWHYLHHLCLSAAPVYLLLLDRWLHLQETTGTYLSKEKNTLLDTFGLCKCQLNWLTLCLPHSSCLSCYGWKATAQLWPWLSQQSYEPTTSLSSISGILSCSGHMCWWYWNQRKEDTWILINID